MVTGQSIRANRCCFGGDEKCRTWEVLNFKTWRWQESRVCLWYSCRAAVTTAVAETVYAIDITMSGWGVRASRLVFGKDEQLKKLRNRELCGGLLGRGTVWCRLSRCVLRQSGAGLNCLCGGVQRRARRVRRDNKSQLQLWGGRCGRCLCRGRRQR